MSEEVEQVEEQTPEEKPKPPAKKANKGGRPTKKRTINQLDEEKCLSFFVANRLAVGTPSTIIQQQWLAEKDKFYDKSSHYDDLLYRERLAYLVRSNRQRLGYAADSIQAAVQKATDGL